MGLSRNLNVKTGALRPQPAILPALAFYRRITARPIQAGDETSPKLGGCYSRGTTFG